MKINRRNFLLSSLLAGVTKTTNSYSQDSYSSEVKLGNTDIIIPEIGYGSSSTSSERIALHAYDKGIRYFDTTESYHGGDSETAIGNALSSVRNDIVIGTKTKARTYEQKDDFMKSLEGSLRRLKTDYIDIYYNHAVNSVNRLRNEEWWEFIDLAKQQGKIRYSGVSGHGSNLAECLDYCIDNNLVDVILSAFSFAQDPKFLEKLRHTFHFVAINPTLPIVLEKARKKGIGVIAMKTLAGARLNDMKPYEELELTYAQAAIKWALNTNYADAAVISMTSDSLIDELAHINSKNFSEKSSYNLLEKYFSLNKENICPPGCNSCNNICPNDVHISDVMRSRMYAVDYKNPDNAILSYSQITNNAASCSSCIDAPCLDKCNYNLDIKSINKFTHKLLS